LRHVPRVTFLMMFIAAVLFAPTAAHAERPSLAAVRAEHAVRLDGVLDEADWQRAPVATAFRVLAPREGEAPAESTVVRVLYDDTRVIFGIWCSARKAPRSSLTARDGMLDGDNVIVHLDTEGDGQRAYIFGLNPQGVQVDGILTGGEPDFRWDAVWDAAAHRDSVSWSVEIAVPFRALRFPKDSPRPWRLWVRRENVAWNEATSWPPYLVGTAGAIMLQAADVTGISGVRSGHASYIEPYVFGSLTDTRGPDASDAGSDGLTPWERQTRHDAGVDVQTALTSRLTLNATVRPDFSQIESDALLIDQNQRYPLQYTEKRPFFLEGGEYLSTPLDLLYTRRIAAPRAGAKITGRALGWDSGALLVRDDGGASLAGSGYGGDADSRPGWFGVVRGARPVHDGDAVGFLAGVHTQDAPDGVVFAADTQRHTAASGTVNGFFAGDASVHFGKNWSWTGQAGWTQTRWDSLVNTPARRQSTSFGDVIAVSRLQFDDGVYHMHLGLREIGPHYRDEVGFQDRYDARMVHLVTRANMRFKSGPLQQIKFNDDVFVAHDTHGVLQWSDVNPWVTFSFRRNAAIGPGVEWISENWLGRQYPQVREDLYTECFLWRAVDFTCFASVGDAIAYGGTDADSYAAWTETEDITANVRPREWVTAETNVKHFLLAREAFGAPVIEQWLTGVKLTAQFTHLLSVRLYPQYDSASRHFAGNALVGYVVHPGTVLYLGVNGGFDKMRTRTVETARQVFLKASYRFEL
jgi:hypothetical protein